MKKYYQKYYILLFLFFSIPVSSHDLWIEKKENQWILNYGHILPHKTVQSPSQIKYNKDNIIQAYCFTNQMQEILIEKTPFFLPECKFYFIKFSSGYWTQTIEGLKNIHPSKTNSHLIDSWESYEILKQIHIWDDQIMVPLSNELEIIPLENVFQKEVGDKLKIQILLNKEPVAGIHVSYFDDIRGTTNSQGMFKIKIQKKGMQIIKTSIKIKRDINKIITSIFIFNL